jgi:hypothetical protein
MNVYNISKTKQVRSYIPKDRTLQRDNCDNLRSNRKNVVYVTIDVTSGRTSRGHNDSNEPVRWS